MSDYAPTPRTRIKRHHERGHYDRETVHAILDAGLVCHVGFVADGQPFVVPTLYWREGESVLIHGSTASRMIRALKAGAPACLTVSLIDGLVLARSGMHHSANYRSVMILGSATAVTGRAEKTRALRYFIERLTPGRWDQLRPPTTQEIKATTVLAFALDEVSAKVRNAPPKDDEEDYALPVWAGVVPLETVARDPTPDSRLNPTTPVPDHALRCPIG